MFLPVFDNEDLHKQACKTRVLSYVKYIQGSTDENRPSKMSFSFAPRFQVD